MDSPAAVGINVETDPGINRYKRRINKPSFMILDTSYKKGKHKLHILRVVEIITVIH